MLKVRLAGALCASGLLLAAGAATATADTSTRPADPSADSPPALAHLLAGVTAQVSRTAEQLNSFWTPARMQAAQAASGDAVSPATTPAPGDPTYDGPLPGEYIPPSHPFDGVPQAGTFFWTDATGTGRTCSGSVVHSPHGNLVLSAGHCLKGFAGPNPTRNLAFVPQYHDGLKPFGVFPVKTNGIYVPQKYYTLGEDAGAEYDFAFAQTLPNQQGQTVEQAIGVPGYTLLTGTGYLHAPVRMIGYPAGATHPKPIYCWSYTAPWRSIDPADPGTYPRIPCADFIGGTSGGPMTVPMHGAPSGFGVFGVVGGLHTGGNTPSVSYSAYFGKATRELYQQAVNGAAPAHP